MEKVFFFFFFAKHRQNIIISEFSRQQRDYNNTFCNIESNHKWLQQNNQNKPLQKNAHALEIVGGGIQVGVYNLFLE